MTSPPAIGRVVIEIDFDGTLRMEQYINGQRQRTTLDRGNEWWEVVDALKDQQRRAIADAERKTEQNEHAARLRHNRVWIDAEQKFGTKFALDKIKGEIPNRFRKPMQTSGEFGQYLADQTTTKQTKPAIVMPSADDLLP